VLVELADLKVRSYCSEPERGRRRWEGKKEEQAAVYANRRRIRGERGKSLLRQRGEKLERSFAHLYETGGMRRVHLRRHPNILKRLLVHVAAFNLGLIMRQLLGRGTPRGLQGCDLDLFWACLGVLSEAWARKLASQGPAEGFEPHPGFSDATNCSLLLSRKTPFLPRAARSVGSSIRHRGSPWVRCLPRLRCLGQTSCSRAESRITRIHGHQSGDPGCGASASPTRVLGCVAEPPP
jgi:Transposase DDE domain